MSDSTSISGPVTVQPDSAARVAYDLMMHIANYENSDNAQNNAREYWLTLYHQCVLANRSNNLSNVLRKGG